MLQKLHTMGSNFSLSLYLKKQVSEKLPRAIKTKKEYVQESIDNVHER